MVTGVLPAPGEIGREREETGSRSVGLLWLIAAGSEEDGGPQAGFPENCIPTFENTLRHTFALLEVDPRYTKDGEIVWEYVSPIVPSPKYQGGIFKAHRTLKHTHHREGT